MPSRRVRDRRRLMKPRGRRMFRGGAGSAARSGDDSRARPGPRLAGSGDVLSRFTGVQAPAAVRAAGTRVLKTSVRQAPGMVALLALVTLLGIGTSLLLPAALGAAVDAATHREGLLRAVVQLGVLFAVATAADALDSLIGAYYGSNVTARLRHRLLDCLLGRGVAVQKRFPAGDVVSRLTANASSPATFVPLLLSTAATVLVAVGAVVALAWIDLRLALTFFIGVPFVVLLLRLFVANAGDPFVRYQELQAAIITRLLDAYQGVRTIRASGTADREIRRILEPLPDLHESGKRMWSAQGQAGWQMSLLIPTLQVLVLAVGGYALTFGGLTAGDLVAAVSYVGLALGSVRLLDALISALGCQVGAGRVGEVLETVPDAPPNAGPVELPPGPGRVELRDVSVRSYDRVVLDRLQLTVPPGTSVAIVGRSGAGKSLLVSLVGRLLDPDAGEVLLDGVPVSRVQPADLRSAVSYAFERPWLLGQTVHDAIAYARPETSRADVEAAARSAQCDRFIRLLPEGYGTALERTPLSGGELQRLGLARAILGGARVTVLDDATSSLDTATEVKVGHALDRILSGRTSLVVAHRAATAAQADLVAWLDGGRVRALAPHQVLWTDPDYQAIFLANGAATAGNGGGHAVLEGGEES